MYIETSRIIVRDFAPEDAAELHDILGDDETMEYCEPAYDFRKTQRFLNSFCIEQRGAVAAVGRDNGRVIGYILFNELENEIFELGWIFNKNFWRQGYAYEACEAVIDYAFRKKKARKIIAETTDALKSVRLMEKLGMQFGGKQADMFLYELTYKEWKLLKKESRSI